MARGTAKHALRKVFDSVEEVAVRVPPQQFSSVQRSDDAAFGADLFFKRAHRLHPRRSNALKAAPCCAH